MTYVLLKKFFRFFRLSRASVPTCLLIAVCLTGFLAMPTASWGQEDSETTMQTPDDPDNLEYSIFDDTDLLNGYAQHYAAEPEDVLVAMIQDDTLSPYRMASAVRVFRENFSRDTFSREKLIIIKYLLRRLNRSTSPFVHVEIMHTLCIMDRYKFFDSMVPALIQKLDHYNATINQMTYQALNDIIQEGHNRPREARIVFLTLRKMMFLSRRRLADVTKPDERLKQKLNLIRWSVKVLGSQELKRLPKEVINLL